MCSKSSPSLQQRFWSKVRRSSNPDDCWHWTASLNYCGYGKFGLNGVVTGAHRVAWILTFGPIPNGLHVLHRCDVRDCVNPAHLFLGTQADNNRDAARKGRTWNPNFFEPGKAPGTKLDESDVREIRRRYAAGGVFQKDLAREFGVEQTTISRIVRRIDWSHVD